ncbi:MAG: hypothetical protein R6T78_01310 [Dehalococcoidales bacterium]
MGKRDYRHREPKKARKDSKKSVAEGAVMPPSTAVEVVKKRKKEDSRE